jgi:hypothetical protein
MPRTFDPAARLTTFLDFNLKRLLSIDWENLEAPGLNASNVLPQVIDGWLVGLEVELRPVLHNCVHWLQRAHASKEVSGFRQYQADALALATWMNEGVPNVPLYVQAKNKWRKYLDYNDPEADDDLKPSAAVVAETRGRTRPEGI